jgi:hypothetical protein
VLHRYLTGLLMPAEVLRAIRRLLPDIEIIRNPAPDATLYGGAYSEQPTLRPATVVEGETLRAIKVRTEPHVQFSAFLDGIQRVQIISHWRGVPIIMGTVSAVVRVRQQRRFITWVDHAPIVSRRLYLPRCYIPGIDATSVGELEIVDTAEVPVGMAPPSRHPGALRACAIDRIRSDRERVERQLAEAWCTLERTPICIDGGISASDLVARSGCAVGVIKSHQTLYADADALGVVLALARGERSSVFRIEPRGRTGVVSWYLRLRDSHGEDAMFGLVRVEAAETGDLTTRADEISSWILAECTPLSLPDGRWDKMTYGIRDCEEFLRAIR